MQVWNLKLLSGTLGIPSGGGGCAAHRPPHQKGRKQSASICKSVVTAFIKALCYEVRSAAKGMPKHASEAIQNPGRHVPKPSKIEARGVPGSQNAGKRQFRSAKRRPRAPKQRPRGPQDAPLAPSWRPKILQNGGPDTKKSMLQSNAFVASIL